MKLQEAMVCSVLVSYYLCFDINADTKNPSDSAQCEAALTVQVKLEISKINILFSQNSTADERTTATTWLLENGTDKTTITLLDVINYNHKHITDIQQQRGEYNLDVYLMFPSVLYHLAKKHVPYALKALSRLALLSEQLSAELGIKNVLAIALKDSEAFIVEEADKKTMFGAPDELTSEELQALMYYSSLSKNYAISTNTNPELKIREDNLGSVLLGSLVPNPTQIELSQLQQAEDILDMLSKQGNAKTLDFLKILYIQAPKLSSQFENHEIGLIPAFIYTMQTIAKRVGNEESEKLETWVIETLKLHLGSSSEAVPNLICNVMHRLLPFVFIEPIQKKFLAEHLDVILAKLLSFPTLQEHIVKALLLNLIADVLKLTLTDASQKTLIEIINNSQHKQVSFLFKIIEILVDSKFPLSSDIKDKVLIKLFATVINLSESLTQDLTNPSQDNLSHILELKTLLLCSVHLLLKTKDQNYITSTMTLLRNLFSSVNISTELTQNDGETQKRIFLATVLKSFTQLAVFYGSKEFLVFMIDQVLREKELPEPNMVFMKAVVTTLQSLAASHKQTTNSAIDKSAEYLLDMALYDSMRFSVAVIFFEILFPVTFSLNESIERYAYQGDMRLPNGESFKEMAQRWIKQKGK